MGLFGKWKKRARSAQAEPSASGGHAAPAQPSSSAEPPAPAGSTARPARTSVTDHPVCGLRAGLGRAEVIARIGAPTSSMTSGQVRQLPNVVVFDEDEADEQEEYWLYKGGDAVPGFLFEVLIRSGRLATVRVKPLGPDGRDLGSVIRINEHGVQAVSPYREVLGAQPSDW